MGLTWDVDPVLWSIGGVLELRYYGLIFSLMLAGGYLLFRWQIKRAGGSEDDALDLIVPGVIGTVAGARLGHVLFYDFHRLWAEPLWVFKVWEGGLASHGAAVGLIAALWYYARRHRHSLFECFDRFSFSAALGATLVRIGNFFNSEIVGRVTDGTWGVRFPRYDLLPPDQTPLRHPSQLYEAGLGVVVLALLLWVDRRFGRERRPRGLLAGTFLAAYFTGRFLVEFFKEYQVLPESFPLTMGQLLSMPGAAAGYVILWISLKQGLPAQWAAPAGANTRPVKTSGKPWAGTRKKKRSKR